MTLLQNLDDLILQHAKKENIIEGTLLAIGRHATMDPIIMQLHELGKFNGNFADGIIYHCMQYRVIIMRSDDVKVNDILLAR